MDSSNPYFNEFDESQLGGGESPLSSYKATYLSPKKSSRRSIQKRVVSIPIKDVQGSRLKGESSAPPADSWAWRKYGQKPIKGSPYPRGYYRCSGSKGCPAKKQVERSHVDPTLLLITYSSEHNHLSPPASRGYHHTAAATSPARSAPINTTSEKAMILPDPVDKFVAPSEESLTLSIGDEFGWFADMSATSASTTLLESPIFVEASSDVDADMSMFFTIKEEDESLFADLGELPECSLVFRRGLREESRWWCGTT